jgi:hypothetical protein
VCHDVFHMTFSGGLGVVLLLAAIGALFWLYRSRG